MSAIVLNLKARDQRGVEILRTIESKFAWIELLEKGQGSRQLDVRLLDADIPPGDGSGPGIAYALLQAEDAAWREHVDAPWAR